MLYVFQVDIGMMLTFDMSVAMQSVTHLQDAIMKRCHIPRDKQVLLISGGDNLDPSARVCSYSAGTDSNPIFLFSKLSIESATPPAVTSNCISVTDAGLITQLETSLHMPPAYETIACRAQLALQLRDAAHDMYVSCQRLVHDQHLQHQGWAAVTANLDDITSAFRARSEVFLRSFDDYLSIRTGSLEILSTFGSVTHLLSIIPLLSCLSKLSVTDAKTLLDWINAQDKRNTLEQIVQQCQTGLEQYDSRLRETLANDISAMLTTLDNASMIEVKGVEERLSRLEHMMIKARDSFDDIVNSAQGLVQNQIRARSLQDTTVLPDLCMKHREVLTNMMTKFQLLVDLVRRISAAKDELSANLHTRLRWVMLVEKSICDIDSKLVIRHETLKKIKHRIEILRQIHSAPSVYCQALVEVVRRKRFSSQFTQWADSVYEKYSQVQSREKELREQFEACIGKHFLKALFPGFEDFPPSFVTKMTAEFDNKLPDVTRADIDFIQRSVPQLASGLRMPFEDFTIVSATGDTLPVHCDASTDEQVIDVSSQSVEIISHEESQLLKLESLTVPAGDDVLTQSTKFAGSPDNGRMSEAFMTADFYIDESLPSSPATDTTTRRKLAEVSASLQEKTSQIELLNQQLSELQILNVKLENELSDCVSATSRMRLFLKELRQIISHDTSSQLADADDTELTGLIMNVKSLLDQQHGLQTELEQKQLECLTLKSELEKCQQTLNTELKQLEADHLNKCRQIEESFAVDKKSTEEKISCLEDSLLSKESTLVSCQSEKEMLVKKFEETLSLQKAQIEQEANDKYLIQVKAHEDRINCILEEHHGIVDQLKLVHEANVAEMKTCLEKAEHEKKLLEIQLEELNTKLTQTDGELSSLQGKLKRILEAFIQLRVKLIPAGGFADLDADNMTEEMSNLIDRWMAAQQEEQKNSVKLAAEQHQLELDRVQSGIDEIETRHQQSTEILNEQHAKDIVELTKRVNQTEESLEQEKKVHERTLEELKEKYENIIADLNEKLLSQQDSVDVKSLGLVAEDYIPLQRHDEVVIQLRTELKLADEQKTIELKNLLASTDQKWNEMTADLVSKHERELHELKSQYEQEILALKRDSMKHEVVASQMTESVIPAAVTVSMHRKSMAYAESRSKEVIDREMHRLEEKLAELSLSRRDYEQVKQRIVIGSCENGDLVLFTWNEKHRHYIAFLPEDCPKHFLHSDCLESLGISADVAGAEALKKLPVLLRITNKEYCLAKKPQNRFRVPVNTRFFRVKAELYIRLPSPVHSSSTS